MSFLWFKSRRGAGTVPVIRKVVSAGPAIERQSVMRRKLIHLAAALSLLLLVAVSSLWAVSHWRAVQLRYVESVGPYREPFGMFYRSGLIEVYRGHILWADELRPGHLRGKWKMEPATGNPVALHGGVFGLRYERVPRPGGRARVIAAPLWPLALVSGAAPAVWLVQWRRRSRLRPGHCRTCGYDLRATPDKCPECGHVPATAPAPNPRLERIAAAVYFICGRASRVRRSRSTAAR